MFLDMRCLCDIACVWKPAGVLSLNLCSLLELCYLKSRDVKDCEKIIVCLGLHACILASEVEWARIICWSRKK